MLLLKTIEKRNKFTFSNEIGGKYMTCINSDYDMQCILYGGNSMQNIIVSKWGNSIGVKIPSNIVKTLDIKEEDTLTIKELKDSFNISNMYK